MIGGRGWDLKEFTFGNIIMELHELAPEVLNFLWPWHYLKQRSVKRKISLFCVTLMVSLWISHGGWQSRLNDKCHTPLRSNSEYSTHDHFCFASLRFHIFSHTITGDRIFCFWSVIIIIEHVCKYIYFIIDMMGGHPFRLYLPPEGTRPLTTGHLCGQSAWSSLNQFLHQRPQSQNIILSLDVPKQRALTILSAMGMKPWEQSM